MEEEWDIIESTHSSSSNYSQQKKSLIELNFNRFANQPVFEIKDDDPKDYDQQLIDQGVIFCDSPPLREEAEINLTLGKLTDNDTNQLIDDVKNMDNELEQQRINQFKNSDLTSFFPFIIMNNTNNKEENTRESHLEKNAVWKNSNKGSSVPYMSDEINPIESYPNFGGNITFSMNNTIKQSPLQLEEIRKKLNNLQLESENNDTSNENNTSIQNDKLLSRPIKQIKKNNNFTLQVLPSYAATPDPSPLLIYQVQHNIDIPPEKDELNQQDPNIIKQKLSECFEFNSQQDDDDNNNITLATIFYNIETISPNITQWYQLKTLDLSKSNLTSLNHLNTCFPMLENLVISHNKLKSLSGLPESLRYLHVSHNKLREIDIYHLDRLQYLNLSHNLIQSFQDMTQLKSLRTFNANDNVIESCQPFQNMTHLINLSLKSNRIRKLSGFMNTTQQHQLESLDLSFNRIECIDSFHSLNQLRELNLNYNDIKCIRLNQPMEKLCSLKLCFNRLKSFDVSLFPEVRILYLDDNQIERMIGVTSISRLDSFSIRDQGRQEVKYDLQYLRGTRKLYLSGSPFKNMHQLIDFYSLEYLELCSSELKELPLDFSKRVPNLCYLYLSMNNLQDIRPLKRLKYLRRLILIDNKISSFSEVVSVVKHLQRLNVLDLRQNPMCSNFYPTLNLSLTQLLNGNEKLTPYIATANDATWITQDLEFSNQLSHHWRTRREVYRALLIKECPKLKELDHLPIRLNDREDADIIIKNYRQSRNS